MPYSKKRYGTKSKFRKMKRCVAKVKFKSCPMRGGCVINPYAVCRASIYKKRRRR